MDTYVIGTMIELDATFRDLTTGNLADPTTVTVFVRNPAGIDTNISSVVVRSGVGEYKAPYLPLLSGLHTYRFVGAGSIVAADEGTFLVRTEFAVGVVP